MMVLLTTIMSFTVIPPGGWPESDDLAFQLLPNSVINVVQNCALTDSVHEAHAIFQGLQKYQNSQEVHPPPFVSSWPS